MADHPLPMAPHCLPKRARQPEADAPADRDLLDRFVAHRDQAAFAALVERHGPMVLRLCRRVLHRTHDAEDACQAAFLVLARKAASIRRKEALASWLHGVAYHVASNLRRAESRHGGRLAPRQEAVRQDPAADASWREVRTAIDQELAHLPQRYRAPLILCYLEERTRDEAARLLGWGEGTLRGRLERGRDALRARLIRRGIGLSSVLLAGALEGEAASPARALSVCTVGAERAVSAKVASLAQGVLKAMLFNKLRAGAAVVLVLSLAVAGSILAWGRGQPVRAEPGKPAADAAPSVPAQPAEPAASHSVRVVVLDAQGKPLPGANVHSSIWTEEKGFQANHDYKTDDAGAVQVELPKTYTIVRLWAGSKPYVTMYAGWEERELAAGKKVPAEYTMRLESAATAGGRVVDEDGKPIAGAKVQVMMWDGAKPADGDGRVGYDSSLATGSDAATTDAEGRWRIDNVPNSPQAKLDLLVSHPDYASDQFWEESQKASGVTQAMLRQGTATITLKRGVVVRGRVTDPDGKPIKDALLAIGDRPYFSSQPSEFPTDADGRYRLPALPPGETTLTVIANGWASQLRKVNVQSELAPQDFRLARGKTIRLRIVDVAGKPIPSADVMVRGWKGAESLQSFRSPGHPKVPDPKFPDKADNDGIWEWSWAPDDPGPVKLEVGLPGFVYTPLEITGGSPERTVTLKPEHRVTGRVTDAATGKPIPAFTVIPVDVFRKDFLGTERHSAMPGQDGRLDFTATRTDISERLRVEALGYRTQDGPEFRVGDDAARTQDFRLQPSPPVAGVVLDAAGKPVANAEVLMATPTEQVAVSGQWDNHKTSTDAAGRFAFPDSGEPWAVIVRSDAGYAFAEFPADRHDAGALRLQPWAAVRGQFRDGGKPIRGATILLEPIRLDGPGRPTIAAMMQTVTDVDGRFEFPQAPPGPVTVWVSLGPWKDEGFRSGPRVPLDLQPGQHVDLDLGGAGAVVTGKVKLTGKLPPGLDCTYSLNYLVSRERGIAPPPEIAGLGFDARNGWRESWEKSTEGLAYLSTLRHWFVKLAADGTFRISGVPPGEYDLAVAVYAKPGGCLVDPLAQKVVHVTVTAADVERGELALPEVAAEVKPVPAVGDTPALAFHRADGAAGKLADGRGRYTVVHFWASWCGVCKQQLPALRRLQERFASRGLAVLSLSLDDDAAAWKAALKRLDPAWPQGRLDAADGAGVSGVPEYWLLDADGKIVSKVYDPDELAATLTDRLK